MLLDVLDESIRIGEKGQYRTEKFVLNFLEKIKVVAFSSSLQGRHDDHDCIKDAEEKMDRG